MSSRKAPLSLVDQAGLGILELLQGRTYPLESEYMKWLPNLSNPLRHVEETMNIQGVDTSEVLRKYNEMTKDIKTAKQTKRGNKSKRGVKDKSKEGGKEVPDPPEVLEQGIPAGVVPEEYIQYRKCLYLDSIQRWKAELVANLSPPTMEHLLNLLTTIFRRSRETNELGIFSLQALLVTEFTHSFLINATSYNPFYCASKSFLPDCYRVTEHMIGPTILRQTLLDARRLTSLALERVCTDKLLELVGTHITNLKYLNISQSLVTDRGLLDLVGVRTKVVGTRKRLPRTCKSNPLEVIIWEFKT